MGSGGGIPARVRPQSLAGFCVSAHRWLGKERVRLALRRERFYLRRRRTLADGRRCRVGELERGHDTDDPRQRPLHRSTTRRLQRRS